MKGLLKFLFSLAIFCILTGLASQQLQMQFNIPPLVTTVCLVGLTALHAMYGSKRTDLVGMDVNVEYWVDYIIQRLRKSNLFLNTFYDESRYSNGRIVHIPQPGAAPAVVKNRNSYPASAVTRTDTDILYSLDEYTTTPTHIPDIEKTELSYDKMNDVLGDHMDTLTEVVGDDLLIKIIAALPQGRVVETTGGATAPYVTGQTGNRKIFMPADLKRGQTLMNLQNVPKEERYAILESNMLDQLTSQLDVTANRDFSRSYDPATGVLGELYGFKIMERSTVAMAAASYSGGNLAVNALGAAVGATNECVSLCYHRSAVSKAMGEVKLFQRQNDPLYYGDIYSTLVRMGSRRRRADNNGVIAIKGVAAS